MRNYKFAVLFAVSSQQKRKMMKQQKNNLHDNFLSNVSDDFNGPSSSRMGAYYSEEVIFLKSEMYIYI